MSELRCSCPGQKLPSPLGVLKEIGAKLTPHASGFRDVFGMKVDGTRITEAMSVRRTSRPTGAQGVFSLDQPQQAPTAAPVRAPMQLGAVDSLLALQAAPDAMTMRARAVRRGQTLLDLLDEIRDGLLSGQISQATLQRLTAALQVRDEGFEDPGLQSVMDDIELRAQVELAKMQTRTRLSDSNFVA